MLVVDAWAQRWGIRPDAVAELKNWLSYKTPNKPDGQGKNEAEVQALIRIEASNQGHEMLRNNSGAMQDDTGRVVRFGLGNDSKRINNVFASSDLIGVTSMVVQQKHVGCTLGVFTVAEVKDPNWTGPNPNNKREVAQANFINHVKAFGGIGGFCTSVEDYKCIIGQVK